MNGSIITIDERTSGIVDVFFNPPSYRHNVKQFVQNCATELGIDTSVLNLTNFVPMTLSSGPTPPVLLLQDPVLVKVLTLMLDVVGTLFNYWTLFCKRGLIFSFIHLSDFQDTFYRDNPSYRREERREGRKVKF